MKVKTFSNLIAELFCVYFTFKFTVKSICTLEIMFSEFFSYDNSVLVDN